jgi:hypothetical protein
MFSSSFGAPTIHVFILGQLVLWILSFYVAVWNCFLVMAGQPKDEARVIVYAGKLTTLSIS